jgi:hypothetical protein
MKKLTFFQPGNATTNGSAGLDAQNPYVYNRRILLSSNKISHKADPAGRQLRRPKIKTARAANAGSGGWNRHRDARTCFKIGGSTLYEQGLLRCSTAKQPVASAHDRRYDDAPFQGEGSGRILTMCWDCDWKSKALHCARTHLSLLFLEGRLIFREYTRCYSLRTTR